MDIREFMDDIVTFANPISVEVLLTPEEDGVKVECMNETRTVILKGKSKESTPLITAPIGMNNLNILKGLIRHPVFLNTNIEVITEKVGKSKIPTELNFHSENKKVNAIYRFMDSSLVPPQPKFKTPDWDVIMEVELNKFEDFSSFASIFPTIEKKFAIFARDNNLIFSIGGKNTNVLHGVEYEFTKLEEGHGFDEVLFWPLMEFLNTMKLAYSASENSKKKVVEVKLTKLGAMQISCESKTSHWYYILPAKKV